MSGLKERLNRLKRSDETKSVSKPEMSSDGWERLSAALEVNEWGAFIKRTIRYSLDYRHGHYELGAFRETAAQLMAFHEEAEEELLPEHLLFFDTETTGLGLGAGNVPFMLGLGFFEKNQFILEQLFIRNPAEEFAMLNYFSAVVSRFRFLVSYNGRTFDWPIVKNRLVLNRLKLKNEEPRHLDFLYPSRSLWRNTLPSCRLGNVEEGRLGFARADDVPGSLAPELYFRYLAEGDSNVMHGVFVHNEHDILSLAGLAIHFSHALAGKIRFEQLSNEELYRIGLWLDKMEKPLLSEAAFACLLERLPMESSDYCVSLASFYKKKGDQQKAVHLWHEAIARRREQATLPLEPYIELAMHYEHKLKDYRTALYFAEEALQQARKRDLLARSSMFRAERRHDDSYGELKKRIDRLQRKNVKG